MGVIFIAGVYGVGKTTVCDNISNVMGIPHYSASDLISNQAGETYGKNKAVSNVQNNQNILIEQVKKLLFFNKQIILSGHFCIFDKENQVIQLPLNTFKDLEIEKIVLLEKGLADVICNLKKRDHKRYTHGEMCALVKAEESQSLLISNELNVPIYRLNLQYNQNDVNKLVDIINGGLVNESIT